MLDRHDDASIGAADITDPALYTDGDPHAVFRELRRHRPIHLRETADGRRFWVLTRHADQLWASRHPKIFTTEHGLMIDTIRSDRPDPSANLMLETAAPDRHRELRRELDKAYSREALEKRTGSLRRYAQRVIDEAVAKGSFDFATDVADRVATAAVFGLLGLPDADWDLLLGLNLQAEHSPAPAAERCPVGSTATDANKELFTYLMNLVGPRADELADGHVRMLLSETFGSDNSIRT